MSGSHPAVPSETGSQDRSTGAATVSSASARIAFDPLRAQISARDRRRVLVGLTATLLLLFLGGAFAYVIDFRHRVVCTNGRNWIARNEDDVGEITYLCPGNRTVTEGMLP